MISLWLSPGFNVNVVKPTRAEGQMEKHVGMTPIVVSLLGKPVRCWNCSLPGIS